MLDVGFQLFLLDREVSEAEKLIDGIAVCDMEHRHHVPALCMLYKIRRNSDIALKAALPGYRLLARVTRPVVSVHSR